MNSKTNPHNDSPESMHKLGALKNLNHQTKSVSSTKYCFTKVQERLLPHKYNTLYIQMISCQKI